MINKNKNIKMKIYKLKILQNKKKKKIWGN